MCVKLPIQKGINPIVLKLQSYGKENFRINSFRIHGIIEAGTAGTDAGAKDRAENAIQH